MATLEINTGEGPVKRFEINRREVVVGRHPQCDVVLPDTTVSRRHARILCEKDGYYIEDLASQHGTLLNSNELTARQQLIDRDQISIRDTTITFFEAGIGDLNSIGSFEGQAERPSTVLTTRSASSVLERTRQGSPNEKLRALLEITSILGTSLDKQQIFPQILDGVFRIFPQSTRGYIVLAESLESRFVPQAVKQTGDDRTPTPPISRTIAERVISHGEAILSSDAGEDSRFNMSDSISMLNIRSVMCAPMLGSGVKPYGMIQIETNETNQHFTDDDLDVLVNVANLAGQFVDHAQLHETQLQFDRRQRDLEIAQQVQLHFLPEHPPEIPGYQVSHYYKAADGVGGDYFGYISLPDGRLAIAVGDVAGKGVPAALLMARLCSDIRYCLATQLSSADAIRELDQLMTGAVVRGGFITFVLCVLNPATHEVVIVNAGHMPPLWRRAATGSAEGVGLAEAHPPLGVGATQQYNETSIQLAPNDAVFLYTDGVSEATNGKQELYGTERIEGLFAQPHTSEKTIQFIIDDVSAFIQGTKQADDICMLCFSRED